jgi:hypothetical protein
MVFCVKNHTNIGILITYNTVMVGAGFTPALYNTFITFVGATLAVAQFNIYGLGQPCNRFRADPAIGLGQG